MIGVSTTSFNKVLYENNLMDDWMLSSLVATYKGKDYPLNIKFYWGIKLLEHVFEFYQRILDKRLMGNSSLVLCQVENQFMQCLILGDWQKSISQKASSHFVYMLTRKFIWLSTGESDLVCFKEKWYHRIPGSRHHVNIQLL